ncbi:MAG: hypothetical protein ACKVOW_10165 [Chitinophagaceae bacterium]
MKEINTILADLEKYYSRLSDNGGNSIFKFQLISDIVEKKINNIISGEASNWLNFVRELKNHYPDKMIMDMGYIQFPSYLLNISLEETNFQYGKRKLSLNLALSLLSNFYTIYMSEEYVFTAIEQIDPENAQVSFWRSLRNDVDSSYTKYSHKINYFINQYFPEYTFIPHKLLLSYKIQEISPWPENNAELSLNEASLYILLFDGLSPLNNIIVIK